MKVFKCVALGMMVFLLTVSGLRAGETRIVNMGYQTNFYVRDSYNIWAFPSTIVNYRSMAFVESQYGANALWSGGIHVPVSSTFTLGVYLSNRTQQIQHTDTEFLMRFLTYPLLDFDEAAHQFTVFGGYQMTNMSIGIHVTSYSSKLTYTNPDDDDDNFEDKLGERTYALGMSYKANERTRFDGTVFYRSGSFAHTEAWRDTVQSKEPEGYNTYGVGLRLFYMLSPKTVLVPFLSYSQGGEGYRWLVREDPNTGLDLTEQTYIDKMTEYVIGVGLNFIPHEKNLIALATGFHSQSWTYEETWYVGTPWVADKASYQVFPFISIGLESKLTRWLAARFSFYELLETWRGQTAQTETVLDDGRLTGSTYAAKFGLAFKFGRFTIDALVGTEGAADFLHKGPYLLSGNDNALFTQLSVTYDFSE